MSDDDPDYYKHCNNCGHHIDSCTCEPDNPNRDLWDTTYADELRRAMAEHPDEYVSTVPFITVYTRMLGAFDRGTYNKDSRAIRATCRRLGINHTYKAINEFILHDH
jgi:hypothetical protein